MNPPKAYIVTEGRTDAQLVSALLKPLFPDVEICPAGGTSAAVSFARTLAATREEPCVLLVDADTTTPQGVRERQLELEEMIRSAGPRAPFFVAVASPQMESLLFESAEAVSQAVGVALSDQELRYAQLRPIETLERLMGTSSRLQAVAKFVSMLGETALQPMREARPIRQVIEFLNDVAVPA